MIQSGVLLGGIDGVAAWHDQAGHAEDDLFGLRGEIRQHRCRFEEIRLLRIGDRFEGAGGNVMAVHLGAPDHVVVHPYRVKSQFFGRLRGVNNILDAGEWAGIGHSHAK